MNIGTLKQDRRRFASLLYRFKRDSRKLKNLQLKNQNDYKQQLISRRLQRLKKSIYALYNRIKKLMAFAGVLGAMTAATTDVNAQSFVESTSNSFDALGESQVELVDIDGDGDLDVFINGAAGVFGSEKFNKLFLNDGSGNFTEDTDNIFTGTRFIGFEIGDLDGQNNAEIIVAGGAGFNEIDKITELYINDGQTPPTFSLSSPKFDQIDSGDIELADVDGDGDLDVFQMGRRFDYVVITKLFINYGDANFFAVEDPIPIKSSNVDFEFVDVDQDGDPDLLVGYQDGGFPWVGNTSLFINDGDGNFSEDSSQPLLDLHYLVAASGDIDNDGDIDIFLSGRQNSGGDDDTDIFFNDVISNNANFSAANSSLLDGRRFTGAEFADLDGDGDLDLVATESFGQQPATIFINDGLGSFTTLESGLSNASNSDVTTGDVDGDGDIDILISGASGTKLFINDGQPVISQDTTLSFLEGFQGVALDVDAIDGDGGASDQNITYSIKDAFDGNLFSIDAISGELTFNSIPEFSNPRDINADNIYIVTVIADDGVNTTEQEFTVEVTESADIRLLSAGQNLRALSRSKIEIGRIDADSDSDIALIGYDYQIPNGFAAVYQFETFSNDGGGGFTFDQSLSADRVSDLELIDLDLDGDLDLAVSYVGQTRKEFVFFANDESGVFTDAGGTVFGNLPGLFFSDMAFGDLDGDGDLDMIVSGEGTANYQPTTEIFINYGSNSMYFIPDTQNTFEGKAFGPAVAFADIDGDGDTDVITSGRGFYDFGGIDIYLNDGSGIFSEYNVKSFSGDGLIYNEIAVGDIDNDGDLDFAVTGTLGFGGPHFKSIFLNDGLLVPSFTEMTPFDAADAVGDIQFLDFDQDGNLDAIFGGESSALFLGDGQGGFEELANFILPDFTDGDLEFGDLNGDDRVDFAITGLVNGANYSEVLLNVEPFVVSSQNSLEISENTAGVLVNVDAAINDGTSTADQGIFYSLSSSGDRSNLTINGSTGELSFSSTPDFESPQDADSDNVYNVVVNISDGVITVRQNIAITVTNVNEGAPSITSTNTLLLDENSSDIKVVEANDPDGNSGLTFAIVGGADQGDFIIDSNTGELSLNFTPDFENPRDNDLDNSYIVQVSVTDGTFSDTQTITFDVSDVNDNTPVFTSSGSITINEGEIDIINLIAEDGDIGDAISYSISGGADQSQFTLDPSTNLLSFTAIPDFEIPVDENVNNIYEVQVTASDGSNEVAQTINVTVVNLNDNVPEFISSDTITVGENSSLAGFIEAVDADINSNVTYSISGGSDQGDLSVNTTSGELSFNDPADFENPVDNNLDNLYQVTITASDGTNSTSLDLTIEVTDENDNPPVFNQPTSFSIEENSTAPVGTMTVTDVDSENTFGFSISGGADEALFSIDEQSGEILAVEVFNFENPEDIGGDGVFEIEVTVNDGSNSQIQVVSITVTDVNDVPTAVDIQPGQVIAFDPVGTVIGTLSTEDEDAGDTHTYELIQDTRFRIDGATILLEEVLTNEDVGQITVSVKSTDGDGASVTSDVSFLLEEFVDNEVPVISNISDVRQYVAGTPSLEISAQITDFSLDQVLFHYRSLSESEFSEKNVSASGDEFTARLLEEDLDEIGAYYYFSATDLVGNQTQSTPVLISLSYPQGGSVTASVPLDPNRFGRDVTDYQVISLPFAFEDRRVDNIFDEFGGSPGVPNLSEWRIIRYSQSAQDIVDLGPSGQVELGVGYLFISSEPGDLNMPEVQVNTTEPFQITLNPGWNLIGNPFVKDLDWNQILIDNDATGSVGPLRVIDSSKDPEDLNEYWPEGSTLKKFEGAFVNVVEPVTLEITYQNTASQGGRIASQEPEYGYEWMVPFSIIQGKRVVIGGVGMHQDASDGLDVFDKGSVPVFGDYLELKTISTDQSSLNRSIVESREKMEWQFDVKSSEQGLITLQWPEVPGDLNVKLFKASKGQLIDMTQRNSISWKENEDKRFNVLYSSDPNEEFLSMQIEIGNPYPNPNDGVFLIPLALPPSIEAFQVEISFFDLSGRIIHTEFSTITSGRHEIEIDGGSFASKGSLFYKVKIKNSEMEKEFPNKVLIKK